MKEESKNELDDSRMSLWEHLDELRNVLIRCIVIVGVGFAGVYYFVEDIVYFLEKPLLDVLPSGEKFLYFTGIADKFFIYLKISFFTSVALTSPLLLYQIWSFAAPALYKHERKVVGPFLGIATFAFAIGMAFAYKIVLPTGYQFLIGYGRSTEKPIITLTEYFSMTTQLLLALGFVFELPVALMVLAKLGLITSQHLIKIRSHAYVGLAILAAFITPTPDAFTMCLVMLPLFLLFEVSVFLTKLVGKKTKE